jgi:hypothetical protein
VINDEENPFASGSTQEAHPGTPFSQPMAETGGGCSFLSARTTAPTSLSLFALVFPFLTFMTVRFRKKGMA